MFKLVGGVEVELTPEEVAAVLAEREAIANAPADVPQLIEMRKALVEMDSEPYGGGTLLEAVEAVVAQSPRALQIEFSRATQLSRTRDYVLAIQAALGLSDAYMDARWTAANARP